MVDTDLTPAIPQRAHDAREEHPDDPLAEYSTVNAADEGYAGRSGDLADLIESANANGDLVYCPAGEYEMSTNVGITSGTGGVVGDGSGETRIYYRGTSYNYLFNLSPWEWVFEGVTFDISEPAGDFETDIGLMDSTIGSRFWCRDLRLEGSRVEFQDGISGLVGGRFTFKVQLQSGGIGVVENCHFPDGSTNDPTESGVGHAIGPNSDPGHEGYTVWWRTTCSGFMDNGFYMGNTPDGINDMIGCEAVNNAASQFRPGMNDVIVGGYAETSSLPDDRVATCIEIDSPAETGWLTSADVIGLEMVARGDAYGNEAIQLRQSIGDVLFERCTVDADGSNDLARLDSYGNGDITIEDCFWWLRSYPWSAVEIQNASVTSTNWHVLSEDSVEVEVHSDGSLVHEGVSYGTGSYTAADLGMDDPRPLPQFSIDFEDDPDPDPEQAEIIVEVRDEATFDALENARVTLRRGEEIQTYAVTIAVENESGGAITDGTVTLASDGTTQELDAAGEALFSDLINGTYDFDIEATGYNNASTTVTVDGADVTDTVVLQDDTEPNYVVDMADGTQAINAALADASPGEHVFVEGDGDYSSDWDDVVWLQEGVELEFSNDIFVSVDDSNGLDPVYIDDNEPIYCLMTNENRDGVGDITVRGGQFELYNWDGQTEAYGGVWLHRCWDMEIADMKIAGAGGGAGNAGYGQYTHGLSRYGHTHTEHPSYGHSDYRSGCVILTNCQGNGRNSDAPHVHDCRLLDAGYDAALLRGGSDGLWIRDNFCRGSSSGSIQTARWGVWGLYSYPGENYFDANDGRRIYDHDGDIIHMQGNASPYRLQTIGSREAYITDSQSFEGKVLLYCLDSGSEYQLVENMEFIDAGKQPIAIQIGNNGGYSMDTIDIIDCWAERPTFIHFNDYNSDGEVTNCTIEDSEAYPSGTGSEIVSKDDDMSVRNLEFRNCYFGSFDIGIVGHYYAVDVHDCTFEMSEDDAIDATAVTEVNTSGNTFNA